MRQALGKASQDVLLKPIRRRRTLTTSERQLVDLSNTVRGWGTDLDPARRPGVPMDKAPSIGVEHLYPIFEQQVPRAKVHKSTEHGKLTPVFGNACPPRGVSGLIRDLAYKLSEGRLSRWILLMAADRVDMVEELIIDLAHLRVPNIPEEMGLGSELKYNRTGTAKKAAIVGLGVAAFVAFLKMQRRRSRNTR